MFSTPTVRKHESSDSVMRKPQPGSTRKALQDRGVNSHALLKTPIAKKPLSMKTFDLQTPKTEIPLSPEPAVWEMEMLRCSPTHEMNKFEFYPSLFEERMFESPQTPSPLKRFNDFDINFDFMKLPPVKFQLNTVEDTWACKYDVECFVAKPDLIDFIF